LLLLLLLLLLLVVCRLFASVDVAREGRL